MAASFQRVPCRSLKPISSGPKPIENTSTRTPHIRATRKWPSSWKNTTMVRTNRKAGRMSATDPLIPNGKLKSMMLVSDPLSTLR
jgi:hypothetical protein